MRTSNQFHVTGNLGAAVELREIKDGEAIAKLSIAETVSRLNVATGQYEQVHTNWIPVTAFGSLARRAAKSLKKGDRVTVFGSLKISSYEKDGVNRRSFEVIADSIEKTQLLSKADGSEAQVADGPSSFDEYERGDMRTA